MFKSRWRFPWENTLSCEAAWFVFLRLKKRGRPLWQNRCFDIALCSSLSVLWLFHAGLFVWNERLKCLFTGFHVKAVARTSSLRFSLGHLADFVKEIYLNACCTWFFYFSAINQSYRWRVALSLSFLKFPFHLWILSLTFWNLVGALLLNNRLPQCRSKVLCQCTQRLSVSHLDQIRRRQLFLLSVEDLFWLLWRGWLFKVCYVEC